MKKKQTAKQWKKIFVVFTLTVPVMLLLLAAAAVNNNTAVWKSIIFGQTTLPEKNTITLDPASKSVTLVAGTKDGSVVGGKITGSHDGISYYYTEINSTKNFILTAKIKVNFFAKDKPDNQEAFGIMARDAIGKENDASVFASNIVMVGGYRGNIQSVYRDNVMDSSGTGATMEDVKKFGERPANDGSAVFTMTMKKTNTGYSVSVNNGPEKIYYKPKLLEVIDKSKIYVGFFTARVASITVSDISFTTSDVATDPAGEAEPEKAVAAAVNVISPKTSSLSNYNLNLSSNVSGKIKIKLNGAESSGSLDKPGVFSKTFNIVKGENIFDIEFAPDSKNSDTVKLKLAVIYKTYGKEGGTIYASSSGKESAAGTLKDPIDIFTAVNFVQPGQTILLAPGTYKMTRSLLIEKGNNGEKGKIKTLKGSDKTILDFDKKSDGVIILANRWKIYGVDITGSNNNGIRISGNYNIIERSNIYANGNSGLQISGLTTDKIDSWPSYNLVLNCDAYDNRDPSENNADGFAAKVTCGVGNIFRGCIAHNNCDDGYDLYSKLENGPSGAVVVENCIAYGNGIMSDGTMTKGDGNGFKLGGEGLPVKHLLKNSLAFKNKSNGITNNSDPIITIENCTSADNGTENFRFIFYTNATLQVSMKNCISFRSAEGIDDLILDSFLTADNYFIKNKKSANSKGEIISAADFNSIKPDKFKRNADGKISAITFMTLKSSSKIKGGAKLDDYSKITAITEK